MNSPGVLLRRGRRAGSSRSNRVMDGGWGVAANGLTTIARHRALLQEVTFVSLTTAGWDGL